MRLLLALSLCLAWASSQAQTSTVHSKVDFQGIHIPQLTIQEASDKNLRAIGLRWRLSDYNLAPIEFGLHAFAGYGEVARASFGLNLAYLFAEPKSHDFKIGLSLSNIDLEDVGFNKEELGPHIGDISFRGWGNEFKPYMEWEWTFSTFSSFSSKPAIGLLMAKNR